MPPIRFTPDRREQVLQLLEAGKPVGAAAADVGVSCNTIRSWVARGKDKTAPADVREFSGEYRRILSSRPKPAKRTTPNALVKKHEAGRLSESQLLGLLEEAATNLNVRAIELLLSRAEAKNASDESTEEKPKSILDELQAFRARKSGTDRT